MGLREGNPVGEGYPQKVKKQGILAQSWQGALFQRFPYFSGGCLQNKD